MPPVVPTYDRQRVREAPLDAGRVPTQAPLEAFGGGAAVSGALQAGATIAQDAKTRADRAAVLEAENRLTSWMSQALYAPKTGAFNRTGKDAVGALDETLSAYRQQASAFERELRGADQVAPFRQMAEERGAAMEGRLLQHVAAEGEKFYAEQTDAAVSLSQDEAERDPHDIAAVDREIGNQVGKLAEFAARTGKSDEWLEQQTSDAISKTNSRVVTRLLADRNYREAKEFFDTRRNQFSSQDAKAIQGAVAEGAMRAQTQEQSDEIRQTHETLEDRLAAARDIEDPELRQEVTRQVVADYNLDRTARTEVANGIYVQSAKAINEAPIMATNPMYAVDPMALAAMDAVDPSYRENLEKLAAASVKLVPLTTNPAVLVQFEAMLSEDLAKVSETDMMVRFQPNMSATDFGQALTRWNAARNEAAGGGGKDVATVSAMEHEINLVLDAAGLGSPSVTTPGGRTQATRNANFLMQVSAQVRARGLKNPDAIRQLASDMLRQKVAVAGERVSFYSMSEEDQANFVVPLADIPPEDAVEVMAMFDRWGYRPSESLIGEAYRMRLQGRGETAILNAIGDRMRAEAERRSGPVTRRPYMRGAPTQ